MKNNKITLPEQTIKRLTTKISTLNKENNSYNEQIRDIRESILANRKEIANLNKQISELTNNKGLVISEHAILRLLERRYEQGDMIKKVTNQITKELKGLPVNCEKTIDGGLKAIIKNNLLITIK